MCFDPISIGALTLGPTQAISAGLGLVSAVTSVASGVQANRDAQARAAILDQQAQQEHELAEAEAENLKKKNSAFLARARAIQSGGGGAQTGTALMLMAQNAATAKADEDLVRRGGDIRATRLQQEAGLTRSGGGSTLTSGFFRSGVSLLSTAHDMTRTGALVLG